MHMTTQHDIADILAQADRLVREAFERGYRAGAEATRRKILRAAIVDEVAHESPHETTAPVPISMTEVSGDGAIRNSPPRRVERGTVRRVLREAMRSTRGVTIQDATVLARAIEPKISATSIPNEMKRNEGAVYRREGDLWFLIDDADKRTAGLAANDHPADQQFTN